MPTEFDTTLPSVRQVQNMIKASSAVELKLLTGDVLAGRVLWQDQNCICLMDGNNQQTIVWKQAIAYMQPQG